jgi:hypothetical protein
MKTLKLQKTVVIVGHQHGLETCCRSGTVLNKLDGVQYMLRHMVLH